MLSFFQQRLFLIFTFVSSPVSSKVNGIFLAHGFSSFGRCPFGCFCCEIPRTKSLESLNWFRPKWWLLELALSASSLSPLLPIFPFWCCSAFYLHCHFSVAQMRVLVILWYTDILILLDAPSYFLFALFMHFKDFPENPSSQQDFKQHNMFNLLVVWWLWVVELLTGSAFVSTHAELFILLNWSMIFLLEIFQQE